MNKMELLLKRFSSQAHDTLGLLFDQTLSLREEALPPLSTGIVKPEWQCFTLEDEERTEKVYGETRIPKGRYEIKLRTQGGFHNRYSMKFPGLHVGMLELQNVPNFEYVLIHIGNDEDDTAGCLLVGNSAQQNITGRGFIGHSTDAYKRIYQHIAPLLARGGKVFITIEDYA